MRLTVVGCSGSLAGPGSAASCYLVQADDDAGRTWSLVLDLGSGALGALQRYVDLRDLDAVIRLLEWDEETYRPAGAADSRASQLAVVESARHELAVFAELERAPEHIHTYRITRLGLWNARAAGHDADDMLGTLDRWTRFPVPPSVSIDIRVGSARSRPRRRC